MTSQLSMKSIGLAMLALFASFCIWQQPGLITGKMTATEVDAYLEGASKLEFPSEEDKQFVLERLRSWALQDDGKPFYMLNLMRYRQALHQPQQGTVAFAGTPGHANELYENLAIPMLLKKGGMGNSFASETAGNSLISIDANPALDNWSRVLVVRYSSRRHFMELISDPAYALIEPYKLMAMETLLVPTSGDLSVPDFRLILGTILLCAFLAIGWFRARTNNREASSSVR